MTPNRDVNGDAVVVNAITPQVITSGGGAKNSGNVDLRGFAGCLVAVPFGANGGDTLNATNKFTVLVEHAPDAGSDTPGTYEAVGADDIVGLTPVSGIVITVDDAAEDDKVYQFAYVGGWRFVRVTVTPAGTLTSGNPVSVQVVKMLPSYVPAS